MTAGVERKDLLENLFLAISANNSKIKSNQVDLMNKNNFCCAIY